MISRDIVWCGVEGVRTLNPVDLSGKPFHFIGIGGIGMSALAYILAKRNLPVSGSDICLNDITRRLQAEGAHIFLSQDASNLAFFGADASGKAIVRTFPEEAGNLAVISLGADPLARAAIAPNPAPASRLLPQVICSTAINPNNSEYRAALELGCPIFHRSDLLAALMQEYRGIAVAGTHGKTTTSSMIGYLLLRAGLDPTIVVGGEVSAWEGNARLGHGDYLVAEADESDGSLVKLAAEIGVITNIELDHPDHYATVDEVVKTFQAFATNCKVLVGCWDCDLLRSEVPPHISYSLNPASGADYTVDQVVYGAAGTTARVWERGTLLGTLKLTVLGRHNLSNALAAIAVGRHLNLEFDPIATILKSFQGARRRFELRGEANGILFIDDYAHHPSEIQVTLAAARLRVESFASEQRRVVAIFQPHRYSRTQVFLEEFSRSFGDADLVVTTDIYSAGEVNLTDISGEDLAVAIAQHHPHVVYQPTLNDLSAFLTRALKPGDLALFLGAGNLNRILPELVSAHQALEAQDALATYQSA
ncbi:UDP-N-acetylmuramate--L-alanine ligase [Thermoleptolyngbya sp.]